MEDTHVAIRAFFESAGGTVQWDADNRRIIATLEDDTFTLYPSTGRAYRNGEAITLSQPVIMRDNVAYIFANDLLVLFGMAVADHLPMTIATATDIIPAIMEGFEVPGITIAIVDAQEGFTWAQGFGYADSAAGIPVDEHTLFQLASISKPFTAIAVMQLVEAGVVDLDSPITTYLPEFSINPDLSGLGNYENITVRMLMSHASGIQPDLITGMLSTGDYYTGFMDNFLENLSRAYMAAPEETIFSYANNAFTLLGYLVAAIATDYPSIFDGFVSYTYENIFTPAGMELSTFALGERHMPYLSQSYASAGVQEDFVFINAIPTGGLISNASDMALFMHIILNEGALPGGGRLLSANSVRQMFTPQQFNMASGIDYMFPTLNMQPGLGFIFSTGLSGFTHSGHGGNMIHFHSYMAFDLDSGLGVFVAVNSITGMPIAGDLAQTFLTIAVQEKTGTLDVPASDPTVEPMEVEFDILQALEGFYVQVGGSEFMHIVASEDGHLYLHGMAPDMALTLLPLSDGSFVFADTGLRFWFEEMDGSVVILLGEFQTMLFGSELNPDLFAAPEGFEQWVGSYYIQLAPGHTSNPFRFDVGIDDNGFAYMRINTRNGLSLISAVIMLDDYSFMGGSFSQDEDGTWLFIADARYLRAE